MKNGNGPLYLGGQFFGRESVGRNGFSEGYAEAELFVVLPVIELGHFSALRENVVCPVYVCRYDRRTGFDCKGAGAVFNLSENAVFTSGALRVNDNAPIFLESLFDIFHGA